MNAGQQQPLNQPCSAHLQVYVNGVSLQGTAEAAHNIFAEYLQALDCNQVGASSQQPISPYLSWCLVMWACLIIHCEHTATT